MALVELAITVTMEDTDVERLRKAFGRRIGNPNATIDIVLAALKKNAVDQMNAVVVAEEKNVIEESKSSVKPISMG